MIRPSRRRTSPARPVELDLHRRLARAHDRNRHLIISSAVALIAAVAVWLTGMPLEARAAVVLIVSGLAWLVPVPGGEAWALQWIGQKSGLAYQTALELEDEPDRFGFRAGVMARATENLAGVEAPERSAWWLPLLALALGVLLLPSLPLSGGGAGVGGPSFPGGPTGTPAAPSENVDEQEAPELPDAEGRRAAGEGLDPEEGPRGDETESPGEGEAGERAALENFLRNVRERQEQEKADQDAGAVPPEAAAGEREPSGDRPRAARPASEQRRAAERGAEDETVPGEESPNQEPGQEQVNPFSQAADENEAEENADAGEPEPLAEPAEDNGAEAGGDQDDGATPGVNGEGDTEAALDDPGQPGGPGDEGAEGDEVLGEGAGNQPSAEQATGEGLQQEGELLFLEGEARPGPAAGGGTIQLPGDDEVELPEGVARETYRRDVERAISEGRIPLEYQEIIRNYFR